MVEEASVKISFYRFQCGSTFSHKPGIIRNFLKTPPFSRSLGWCPGRWRERKPWDLAHAQTLFSPVVLRSTVALNSYLGFSALCHLDRRDGYQLSISLRLKTCGIPRKALLLVALEKSLWRVLILLAYGGWARNTIGSQNFGVLTKRYDNSLFLRS